MRRRLPLPALRSLLISTIMLVFVSGCFQRAGINTNCEWPYQTQESLDLRKAADQRSLRDKVQLAEELAVRYMDERRLSDGEDSGRRKLRPCMDALFARIAILDNVSIEDIEIARSQRNRIADVAFVILPMAVMFVLISVRLSRRIFGGIDSTVAAACVTLVASVLVTICAVLVGDLWAGLVETIRIGNTHLSFRAARIPWSNQRQYLIVGGLLLFWLVAGLQYRLRTSQSKEFGKTPWPGTPLGLR